MTDKVLIDISITSPNEGNNPGCAANIAFNNKKKKYEEMSKKIKSSFVPIIFQPSGFIHQDSLKYIKKIASFANEEKRIQEDTLTNFFLKRLSITLQKGIANSIIKRYSNTNSRLKNKKNCFEDEDIFANRE